ncbi:flagellar hook-associated protein FlgK [Nocardioides daphniae]|uniref:Flagellar hook-associated protein 1 n=1 Tax=Nocardioides daphniae TaxID=402297 RepID=A0A4P7UDI5_9ACTN|nr:flagellar hook-associated protein FlgK [Nocardioides daphniae]QCC78146.1 flagellar hook-associated protein FlgK [Nocardioides daphniae]GGD21485.1 flagellar hook-associated protein 1 [Nocardioides daphniae]
MSGTFSSFGTALSALHHNRVLMDVASSNIANSATPGYARRRAEAETVGAPAQPAMWSRYDGAGEGVRTADVVRMTDEFLQSRARYEHGNNSYLSTRAAALTRFEAGIGEPGDNGVAAALNDFRTGWHDLAVSPGGDAARSQVLDRAATLVESIRVQASNVAKEEGSQRDRLQTLVGEVNTLASDLADTNRAIAVAGFSGTDANLLLDQRDQLAMRLSELTGGVATQRADGGLDVSVNGTALVTGQEAGRLVVATGATGGTVSLAVETAGGSTAVAPGMRGEIGATADLLTVTLPDYRAGLDDVVRELVTDVNTQHRSGYALDGTPGGDFFAFDAADPAGSLRVAVTDLDQVAASGIPGGGLDGGNATALAATGGAESGYQRLVNGLGSEIASVRRLASNQSALTAQVDGTRDQLAGVNLDEEMVGLVSAQRAYEAASRVMSTLDQMLDTLINRTGLVGR